MSGTNNVSVRDMQESSKARHEQGAGQQLGYVVVCAPKSIRVLLADGAEIEAVPARSRNIQRDKEIIEGDFVWLKTLARINGNRVFRGRGETHLVVAQYADRMFGHGAATEMLLARAWFRSNRTRLDFTDAEYVHHRMQHARLFAEPRREAASDGEAEIDEAEGEGP